MKPIISVSLVVGMRLGVLYPIMLLLLVDCGKSLRLGASDKGNICSRIQLPMYSKAFLLNTKSPHKIHVTRQEEDKIHGHISLDGPVRSIVIEAQSQNKSCGTWQPMRSLSQSADVISCIDNQSHSLIAIYLQKGTHTAQLKFQWKATPQCFPNFLIAILYKNMHSYWALSVPVRLKPAKTLVRRNRRDTEDDSLMIPENQENTSFSQEMVTTTIQSTETSNITTTEAAGTGSNATDLFYLFTVIAAYFGMYTVFSFLMV